MLSEYRYNVDHSIPLPPPRRKTAYPFADMSIGDSFAVDEAEFKKASASAYAYGRLHDMKFTCHSTDDGFRIWRAA